MAETLDFHSYLPPYRSLLNPNSRYDYQTHSLVPIPAHELNKIRLLNAENKNNLDPNHGKTSKIKMKYKSLLSDVSRRTSILSMRLNNSSMNNSVKFYLLHNTKLTQAQFKNLPPEILHYIMYLVDDFDSLKCCLFTNKQFYQLAKPFFYSKLSFTSTYRLSQFITYLRLNSEIGAYVMEIDLSGIRSGNCESDSSDESDSEEQPLNSGKILAGWRDWKFKNNPLYTIHAPPTNSTSLTKVASNSQSSYKSLKSYQSHKSSAGSTSRKRLSTFLKSKRRTGDSQRRSHSIPPNEILNLKESIPFRPATHPTLNRFLMNYANSKDVPIGHVLHMINLCPNIVSLNLGNLSLSIDYEISKAEMYKYQTFDIMNNYPKDLVKTIDGIFATDDTNSFLGGFDKSDIDSIRSSLNCSNGVDDTGCHKDIPEAEKVPDAVSSASSIFSVPTFSKPIRKYNSLLPPLPGALHDISYHSKGDGKVYLSDLNLKAINNSFLKKVKEDQILSAIVANHSRKSQKPFNKFSLDYKHDLRYLNMSSMIWLNKRMVQDFLQHMIDVRSLKLNTDDNSVTSTDLEECASLFTNYPVSGSPQNFAIDLTDSGMYKNLEWATLLDLNKNEGKKLAYQIINDTLLSQFEVFMRRERIRRGGIGENYIV